MILLETNITFKKDGIRIINMDKSHTILAHLFLGAENYKIKSRSIDKNQCSPFDCILFSLETPYTDLDP